MNHDTTTALEIPEVTAQDVLSEFLREGAREMLGKAIESEVANYIAAHAHERDAAGRRLVVRNGHLPARDLQTGLGAIPVKQPRVHDQRVDSAGTRLRFSSSILPPYLRKTKSVANAKIGEARGRLVAGPSGRAGSQPHR